MNAEGENSRRWGRLQELFHRAAPLALGERERLLARECADDPELRREVESLLAADLEAAGLSGPIGEAAGDLAAAALAPGDVVGSYRVVRELGRGGMGVVYLAERTGEDFEQQVALKVLAGIFASPGAVERFLAERRILAQLEHPRIARLLDGGTTPEGAPWFAMERVEGDPIDAWCDRRRLPVRGRLLLFLAVCNALQHAHRRLVVHRDLKPSNILVGADGAPKLLDFGIAKLLDPAAEGAAPTRLGELPMTPEYASPEQVRGEPVTTASDVYALGLLLYELLTGRRAHRLTSRQRRDVERAVCEEPATRPSLAASRHGTATGGPRDRPGTPEAIAEARRATPKALRRRLSGDLDTIVLAALRKEPEQRYGSVEALADDVRRHLDGLPVRARGDRLGYRAGKFVRRHRTAVAAAALAAVSLLAAAGTSTWGLLRARAAEAEARREAAAAEQVAGFLEELFAASDPGRARGADVTAREILDSGVERIGDELQDQPAVRTRLLYVLGRTYSNLGLAEPAKELLNEAIAINRRLHGPDHVATLRAVNWYGIVENRQGRSAEAEAVFRDAFDRARSGLGPDHPLTLEIQGNLGLAVWRQSRFEEAAEIQRANVDARRATSGAEHPDTLAALNNLAIVHLMAGRPDLAEPSLREALESGTRVRGRDHPATLDTLNNLAMAVEAQGRHAEAEPLHRETLELRRRVLGPEHPRTLRSKNNLASLYAWAGRFDEAERLHLEVAESRQRLLGEDHPDTLWSLHNLARVYLYRGEPERARKLAESVLERRRSAFGADHLDVFVSNDLLADVTLALGRTADAEVLYREAATGFSSSLGEDSQDTLVANLGLADSLIELGRLAEAERLLAEARRRDAEGLVNNPQLSAAIELGHARWLRASGRPAEAETVLRAAREDAGTSPVAREIAAELARIDAAGAGG